MTCNALRTSLSLLCITWEACVSTARIETENRKKKGNLLVHLSSRTISSSCVHQATEQYILHYVVDFKFAVARKLNISKLHGHSLILKLTLHSCHDYSNRYPSQHLDRQHLIFIRVCNVVLKYFK